MRVGFLSVSGGALRGTGGVGVVRTLPGKHGGGSRAAARGRQHRAGSVVATAVAAVAVSRRQRQWQWHLRAAGDEVAAVGAASAAGHGAVLG